MKKIITHKIAPPKGPLSEIVFDDARFIVVVSGRRIGKTGQALRWLLRKALECPNKTWENWYIAPYQIDAREIAWLRLKELVPKSLIRRLSETSLEIELVNGNRISIKGADKPGNLVGRAVNSAVFDEYGAMKPLAWEYLRPAFSDTNGSALFIGTPRGANHFRDLYFMANSGELPNFKAYPIFKTVDSPFVPVEEVESARKQMDERLFRQEYEGSFETWQGLVFDSFDFETHVLKDLKLDENLPIYIGMDFGWVDPSVALWMQYDRQTGIWYVLAEFVQSFCPPEKIVKAISGDNLILPGLDFTAPCKIEKVKSIISGSEINIRCQEAGGSSMRAIMRSYGIADSKFQIRRHRIFESVQSVRAVLRNSDCNSRIKIDSSCKTLIRDFMSYHYAEKDGVIVGENPDTSSENHKYSHTMDALRYAINTITPIRNPHPH